MNIIETRNLAQRYWIKASLYNLWSPGPKPTAGWKTKVLFDNTLSVPEGSIYALVGAMRTLLHETKPALIPILFSGFWAGALYSIYYRHRLLVAFALLPLAWSARLWRAIF
jgi:hypothetical protein